MQNDDLEPRVAALEGQVRDLARRVEASAKDAAAARVLAGAADRDVGELQGELRDFRRAATVSFNAIREDFVNLREHVDQGFTELRGKFDIAAAGQQHIVGLLTAVLSDRGHGGPAE